jgi:hypothetical protein
LVAASLVAAALALAPEVASAHAPHDDIAQVVASPAYNFDNIVFTISRDRLMRSVDGGSTWKQIVRGIDQPRVLRLAIAAADKRVMYMSVVTGGVYKSVNQGTAWSRTSSPAAMSQTADLAVSPQSPNVVLAAPVATGVFRTTDGGTTWAQVGSFGTVAAVTFTADGARVIAGTRDGAVYTSDNAGSTWTKSAGIPSGDAVTAIRSTPAPTSGATVFAGTAGGKLYRSTDRGSTFVLVGAGLPAEQVTAIAISDAYPTDNTVWMTTWTAGVYESTDGGATTTRRSTGLTTNAQAGMLGRPQFGGITITAGSNGQPVLFVAGFNGLFRSDDGAATWREVQTLAEYVVGLAVSPDYARDATVMVTTYVKGAYRSTDGGTTWKGSNVGLGALGENAFAPVYRLTNTRFSPNYANDGTIFTAGGTKFLKSTDRGLSWTSISVAAFPPGTQQQLYVIAVSPAYAADQTILLGSRTGQLYRSQSGGAEGSWTALSTVAGAVRSLLFNPAFPSDPVLYASTDVGIYKSADAGSTWVRTGPAGLAQLTISPNYRVDGTLFAGTRAGLYVTRNRGQSWTKLAAAPLSATTNVQAIGVSPNYAVDKTVLVSALGKGLYRSTDGGSTFAAIGTSLITNNLLIADYEHPTSSPIQFSPSYATDRTILGMAEDHIVKSTNGGDTWTVLNLPPASAFIAPPVIAGAPAATTVTEGNSGDTSVLRVAFDLSHPYGLPVTVQWRTTDVPGNPAVADSTAGDYVATSGTLTFPKSTTRQYADIVVNGDRLDEPDELVVVALSNATNATVGPFWGLGSGTIQDDDPPPSIIPGSATITEGDSGSTVLEIPVTLSAASGRRVSVDWATRDYQAAGGEDFTPASGTVTFAPGETAKTFDVTVLGDTTVEPDEVFLVTTSNPSNATLGGFYGLGSGEIVNDDEPPPDTAAP